MQPGRHVLKPVDRRERDRGEKGGRKGAVPWRIKAICVQQPCEWSQCAEGTDSGRAVNGQQLKCCGYEPE